MDFLQREEMCKIPDNVDKLMAPYKRDWTVPGVATSEPDQDPSELTREDQLFLATSYELNHYWRSRMRALALTRSFEHEYEYISSRLREVVSVSETLRDSVSLMNVLGLILDIGNFMNDANKQAQGFKLSSLARLGMVKDDKNETTFADLVERIVRNQYPEWESFCDEIAGVIGLQKVSVDQLATDANKYIANIKNVQSSLDSGNLSDPKIFHPQDRVSQVVQRCMKDARRKAEQMQLYLDEMVHTYDDIMLFYGEDNTDENARRDFFAKLASFVTEWKKSREKNIGLEESRKRTEASLARKRLNVNLANAGGGADAPISPAASGAMDSLLEKLRAAAPQAKDQRDRRRRARLKERHQVRVASGQHVPESGTAEDENSPKPAGDTDAQANEHGLLSPPFGPRRRRRRHQRSPLRGAFDGEEKARTKNAGTAVHGDAMEPQLEAKTVLTVACPPCQSQDLPPRTDSRGSARATDEQGLPSPPQEESGLSEPPSIVVSEQHEPSPEPPADGSSASHPIELLD
ncbi:FH2-domain-containing protein [Penicillium chermesinum]|nr:FH2-domain-containing protein [Penicillium chermesinum]